MNNLDGERSEINTLRDGLATKSCHVEDAHVSESNTEIHPFGVKQPEPSRANGSRLKLSAEIRKSIVYSIQ